MGRNIRTGAQLFIRETLKTVGSKSEARIEEIVGSVSRDADEREGVETVVKVLVMQGYVTQSGDVYSITASGKSLLEQIL